jgi:hypothetical protein
VQSSLAGVLQAKVDAALAMAKELHVKGGKKATVSIRTALKKMELPESHFEPIRSKLRRALRPKQERVPRTLLNQEIEDMLVDLVAAFSVHANPLSGLEVRVLAQVMGGLAAMPSSGWLQALRKRYASRIKLRKARKSHHKTILVNLFTALLVWADQTEKILAGIALVAWLIFNIDETRAIPGSKARSVIADANLTQVQFEGALESTLYTMVGCYAADGSTLFVLYIFKTRKLKNGYRQSFYAPQVASNKVTRTNQDFPVYVAASGKGYMNAELWKETMKIFIDLAGRRQGIDRHKPAVLFLDGCSSHTKSYTQQECSKNNMTAIYFEPNSSHICQPADGQIFQGYKPEVDRKAQELNLKTALGAPDQKHFALAISLEAHRKAVTPAVIRASFKSRGIHPFDKDLISANAHRACPTQSFVAATAEAQRELVMVDVIKELKETLSSQPKLDRKVIEDINTPHKLEEVKNWERAKPTRKAPSDEPAANKKQKLAVPVDESSESEPDTSEDEDSQDETDFLVPRLVRSVSNDKCSHCDHRRSYGTVPLACFDCSQYWLCSPCRTNTTALADHMKTHENDPILEGQNTRRTRSAPRPLI